MIRPVLVGGPQRMIAESRQPIKRVINRSSQITAHAVALGVNDHHLTTNSLTSLHTPITEMIDEDDDEIHPRLSNGGRTHFEMDEAFCGRMRAAIEAGLEKAPIGVVTTPGTKNPKYVPAEPFPLPSSQRAMEHA